MTNCLECKEPVEKEDLCSHRHGMHKSCCKKHSEAILKSQLRIGGFSYGPGFRKEMMHVNYGDWYKK